MKKQELLPKLIKKAYGVLTAVFIIALLIVNPTGSAFVTSLTSQEFVLAHTKDVLDYFSAGEPEGKYYFATGTYEKQSKNELFGAAEGRNLIVLQVESLQNMVIDEDYCGQEITPFLNSLIDDEATIYFDNFYHQLGAGNTSDIEFAVNNSLIGSLESYTYQLYENNYFRGLPWILKDRGYDSYVFHGYKKSFWNRENIYPNLGFKRFYNEEDFVNDKIDGIGAGNITGISDSAFYKQTAEYMKGLASPFYSFVISLSSHNPFGLPEYLQEITLMPEDENIFGRYLQSVNYADRCIGEFFEELKEAGLYDNSMIIIYGDHFGLSKADERVEAEVSDWLGYEYTYANMLNVPLFIHIPGMSINETLSISGAQVDILPTAAYLLGIERLDTLYLGQNLLTAEKGFAAFQMHMLKGSFVKDDIVFEMARNGVFEDSEVFNRITGERLDPADYYKDYLKAKETIELSDFYLKNDILRLGIEEGKSINEINQILSGEKQVKTNLEGFCALSGNHEAADRLYFEITYRAENDPNFYAAVSSDDIYELMTYIDEKYSGRDGKKGSILSVDEELDRKYILFKSRVYPVAETLGVMTRMEYLGYGNTIIDPDMSQVTLQQLIRFVEINRPAGILLDREEIAAFGRTLKSGGERIYFADGGNMNEAIYARALGADGRISGCI